MSNCGDFISFKSTQKDKDKLLQSIKSPFFKQTNSVLLVHSWPTEDPGPWIQTIVECMQDKSHDNIRDLYLAFYGGHLTNKEYESLFYQAFCKCNSIIKMNLSGDSLSYNSTCAMVHFLNHNPNLRTLRLYNCKLGLDGIQEFVKCIEFCPLLADLDLSENDMDDPVAVILFKKLENHHSLSTLKLSSNKIGCIGMDALINVLHENHTLTSLDLGFNKVGSNSVIKVAQNIHSITSLNLQYNSLLSASDVTALAENLKTKSSITMLNFNGLSMDTHSSEAVVSLIDKNKSIKSLKIDDTKFDLDAICKMLRSNQPSLSELDIGCIHFEKENATIFSQALLSNSYLSKLSIRFEIKQEQGGQNHSDELNNEILTILCSTFGKCSTLTSLGIKCNNLGGNGVKMLMKALQFNKTITDLHIFNTFDILCNMASFCDYIKQNKTISKLYIHTRGTTNSHEIITWLTSIQCSKSLKIFSLNTDPIQRSVELQKRIRTICDDLYHNQGTLVYL